MGQARVLGDARDAPSLLADDAPFGLAICLGNMLPFVEEDEELEALLEAVHAMLAPGGLLLVQLLNYVRIVEEGVRTLPINVREGDDGKEIVFVRVMKPMPEGRILFFPTTLELDPASEEPISVKGTKRVPLRAWTPDVLLPAFEKAGFDVALHGDMVGGPFAPRTSHDLVILARRA